MLLHKLTENNAYGTTETDQRTSILPSQRISTQFGTAPKRTPLPLQVIPPRQRQPLSIMVPCLPTTGQCLSSTMPTSATFTIVNHNEEEEFGKEKAAMNKSGTVVHHSQRE